MTACCNCGTEVQNDTVHSIAPACDACREGWREQSIRQAVSVLLAHGYTIIAPGASTGRDDCDEADLDLC